ncbi:MAG: hypothetical protein K6A29_04715 [Lachnospiraceae bacterium]|nr:hypothetical protein [Lachnospiraceae bacterium]
MENNESKKALTERPFLIEDETEEMIAYRKSCRERQLHLKSQQNLSNMEKLIDDEVK